LSPYAHAHPPAPPGRGNSPSFDEESPRVPWCFRLSYEPCGAKAAPNFNAITISRFWLQVLSRYHRTAPPVASPAVAITAHVAGLSSLNMSPPFRCENRIANAKGHLRARPSSCGGSAPRLVDCGGRDLA